MTARQRHRRTRLALAAEITQAHRTSKVVAEPAADAVQRGSDGCRGAILPGAKVWRQGRQRRRRPLRRPAGSAPRRTPVDRGRRRHRDRRGRGCRAPLARRSRRAGCADAGGAVCAGVSIASFSSFSSSSSSSSSSSVAIAARARCGRSVSSSGSLRGDCRARRGVPRHRYWRLSVAVPRRQVRSRG